MAGKQLNLGYDITQIHYMFGRVPTFLSEQNSQIFRGWIFKFQDKYLFKFQDKYLDQLLPTYIDASRQRLHA